MNSPQSKHLTYKCFSIIDKLYLWHPYMFTTGDNSLRITKSNNQSFCLQTPFWKWYPRKITGYIIVGIFLKKWLILWNGQNNRQDWDYTNMLSNDAIHQHIKLVLLCLRGWTRGQCLVQNSLHRHNLASFS